MHSSCLRCPRPTNAHKWDRPRDCPRQFGASRDVDEVHLLFDLDGTLVDSLPGISRCINDALTTLGRDPVVDAQLRAFVGAPLATIFAALLESGDLTLIDRAVTAYRVRYDRTAIFEACLFPGIVPALEVFQQ